MDTDQIASEIKTAIANLPKADTASLRTVRKAFSKQIRDANPREVIELARALIRRYKVPNFIGYELIERHQRTLRSLTDSDLADLALDLNSWWTVDAFACCLAGIAWRDGYVSDGLIHGWARSDNVWKRRAALASTIPLNNKTRGGSGDAVRTLALCDLLLDDREDMVVKGLSWALRELAKRDRPAVEQFLVANDAKLAARVRREVSAKLRTGLKSGRMAPKASNDKI